MSEQLRVGRGSPHGIYVYSPEARRWVSASRESILADGAYVIYFDNTSCSACRKFDETWFPFTERAAAESRVRFVIVLCEWFAKRCTSEDAKELFKEFDVHISPTLVFLRRENGKIVKKLKAEGLMPPGWLAVTYAAFVASLESTP
ncbi:MAG: thioredoxin family protein [Thermofilum sp.]